MVDMKWFGYSLVLAAVLVGGAGCGKGDGAPPPGAKEVSPNQNAAGEFTPPDVSLGSPTDSQASPSKPAESAGSPPAEPEKK